MFSLEMKETDTLKRSYHIEKAINLNKMFSDQAQISVMDPFTLPDKEEKAGSHDKQDGIGTDFMRDPLVNE